MTVLFQTKKKKKNHVNRFRNLGVIGVTSPGLKSVKKVDYTVV